MSRVAVIAAGDGGEDKRNAVVERIQGRGDP
jgi:hypothetical protein